MVAKNKIRLAFLINSFTVGGAEKALVRILSSLNTEKYEITVISLRKDGGEILSDLKMLQTDLVDLDASSKIDIFAIYRLFKLIREKKIDVLIASLFHSTIIARVIGRLAGVPTIMNWEHNENFGGLHRILLNRLTHSLSDRIIADSEHVKKAVIKTLKVDESKVSTVPIGGINIEEFTPIDYFKSKDKLTIGSVGILSKQKGYEYLLEAIKTINSRYKNIRFVIVGDGSERKKLERMAEKLSIQNVEFWGYRKDIPNILATFDIYVQPSLWEGLCISVIEAMACGLPIVATKVGGIPESIIDGENGFLVPPRNHEKLSEALSKLIEDPKLRELMGKRNREKAKTKYSLRKMIKKLEKIVDTEIKNKDPRYDSNQSSSYNNTLSQGRH